MEAFTPKSSNEANVLGYRLDNSNLNRIGNIRISPLKSFAILLFAITFVFPTVFSGMLDLALSAGQSSKKESSVLTKEAKARETDNSVKKSPLAAIWPEEKVASSTPAPAPKAPEVGSPSRLIIPSINVNADIQALGISSGGEMETPDDPQNAGWLRSGPRPGEIGNAVIDGHLDTAYGRAAVFWHLHRLKAGDYIYILDEYGQSRRFRVVESRVYDAENTPLSEIFGSSDKARVNLITCNGVWDRKKQNYSERLVVSAEIAPE